MLTFWMPKEGVIEDSSYKKPDMKGYESDEIIGVLAGEMKSKYVVVK